MKQIRHFYPAFYFFFGLLAALSFFPVFAEEGEEDLSFTLGVELTAKEQYEMLEGQENTERIYETSMLSMNYVSPIMDITIDGLLVGDKKYTGYDEAKHLYGRYFSLKNALLELRPGPFDITIGRGLHRDIVESPYSLFINSGELPALHADVAYESDFFIFQNRWVRLNSDSRNAYTGSENLTYGEGATWIGEHPDFGGDDDDDFPEYDDDGIPWADRGMNYKVYAVKFDDWRFGFQESAVYLHDTFEPELFLSPMPMFITQLIVNDGGRPWGSFKNIKSLMGFFVDVQRDATYLSGQFLLDDINAGFIPGVDTENLTKVAWSFGGRREFSFGRIGMYHAGATKYTFQGTYTEDKETPPSEYKPDEIPLFYNTDPSEYTYYPASIYQVEGGTMPIHYAENYIGYKYGENNLAFMFDYDNTFFRDTNRQFRLYSSLEWIASGAKAPSNPWHEDSHWKDISGNLRLLDGSQEHIFVNTTRVEKPLEAFTVYSDVTLGYIFNRMELERPDIDEAYIFRPQSGTHAPIFELTLGARYTFY